MHEDNLFIMIFLILIIPLLSVPCYLLYQYIRFKNVKIGDTIALYYDYDEATGEYLSKHLIYIVNIQYDKRGKVKSIELENGKQLTFKQLMNSQYVLLNN